MKTSTWLVGRNLTFRITPVTIDVDGTISAPDGNQKSLVGRVDRAALRVRLVNEEISSLDAVQENHVWLRTSNSLELTEILDNDSTNGNILASLFTDPTVKHAKVVILRGGKTLTYYGLIEGYEEGYERGKNVGTMSFALIATTDAGSAVLNPSYA